MNNKQDLSKLSIIFSVKIESEDRLYNLLWNLDYYETCFYNYEIIIVEQGDKSKLSSYVKGKRGVFHYFISSSGVHYKTRNLNHATNLTTRDLVMMCDCDVFCPTACLIESLKRMEQGASFLSPHNGLLVEIRKTILATTKSISDVLNRLSYFPKDFNLRFQEYNFTEMAPLYGNSHYDSTGGCILYRKKDFYLIGGWNTNFISYGFEDMEFVYRLKTLGYTLEKMENYNIYHLEHQRLSDSVYNNLYRSNEAEWLNVSSMKKNELKQYVLNGFRKIVFTTDKEVLLINTTNKYCIESLEIDKYDLSDLSIILPLSIKFLKYLTYLNVFITYLELYYKNYEVLIIEGETRNCKYLSNKKNTQYIWLGLSNLDINHAVEIGVSKTKKEIVAVWDFLTLINPRQFQSTMNAIRANGKTRTLKDRNWYLSGIQKNQKGTGVTLFLNK